MKISSAHRSLDTLLPLDTDHAAAKNTRGLRLFACACAERVLPLLTDIAVRQAVEAGRQHALGAASWEAMEFAFNLADSVKVPKRLRKPHHWATIAATACASVECAAGPRNRGRSPEWAAISAARIASCAAQLAEQGAYFRDIEEIEHQQIMILRCYVPECFEEE